MEKRIRGLYGTAAAGMRCPGRRQVLDEKGDDGWLIANAIIVASEDDGK